MSEELQEALEEISMLIIANCTGGSTDGKRGKEFTDSP